MMKFLCLGYLDHEKMNALPKEEIDAIMSECSPHLKEFYKSGKVILDAGLESETKSLRRVNGKVIVLDGPFVKTKEMIGSAFLIEAEDMEEAIRIASLHPTTQLNAGEQLGWGISIRPIHYFKLEEIPKPMPVVQAEMLIRMPVEAVFEAFIDPAITTKFWFTKSSGRVEAGRHVRWEWEMYGVSDDVYVKNIEQNKRILIEWSDSTNTEWTFTPRTENETFVTITNSGFTGSGDEIVHRAIDAMGGYTMVLCGLKALLEHHIVLNLVADKAPDAHVTL